MITAKVTLQSKTVTVDQDQLTFHPDYNSGRNKEWAKYTPALNFNMSVKHEIGEQFEVGKAYTISFEPNND